MAKISLRAYNRDIEALIEQGRNDEAIAHCRHILKTFPKCLDTYRLLGKGYLEARRFTEAEDILKRLLLAVPDDFIGNLGMSILFDEQKNINNAIWHMERAFEVQPSNTAIQGELRRLYGRRDGLEPPQIRLTRGALAQMYARGNQIPQAIAEIRAMLAEDADRMDLLVLLARVYFRGGQKVEATDTCTTLLKKYPYCLDANRIMVEILADTSRNDSTQIYRHRVNALEPYSAFVTGSLFAAGDVPDGAVILEQLDFEASEFTSPTDLGLSLVDEQAQTPAEEGSESPETAEPPAAPAEEIPEWLKAAGWGAATAEAVRRAEQAAHDENMEADASTEAVDELAQGEVPDWLKTMAPPEAAQAPEAGALTGELESAEADTDWLAGLGLPEGAETDSSSDVTRVGMGLTGAVVAAAAAGAMLNKSDDEEKISAEEPGSEPAARAPEAGGMEEPSASTDEGEWPDSMQETAATEPGAQAEEPGTADADLDWLAGLGVPEGAETDSSSDATQAGMGPGEAVVAAAAAGAMLSESDDEASIFAEEAESEPAATGQALGASATGGPTASTGEAELPDWLQETAVADSASGAETPAEEVPDWLKETAVAGSISETEAPAAEASGSPEDSAGEDAQPENETDSGELGPWGTPAAVAAMAASLRGDEFGPEGEPEGEAETLPGEPTSEVSDWPESLDQADEAQVEVADQAGEEAPVAEAGSEPGAEVEPAQEPAAEVGPEPAMQESAVLMESPAGTEESAPPDVTPEAVAQTSEDDAFAWLESLAAKQGVDPDQLLTKPEERSETAPEWLTQPEIGPEAEAPGTAGVIFAAAAVGEMLSPEHEAAEVAPEPEKAEGSVAGDMEWLEGIEQQGMMAETEGQTPAVSEWLPVESTAEEGATAMPEPGEEETAEQNLVSTSPEPIFEESQVAESGAQPGAEEEMPDWLRTPLEETPSTPEEEGVTEWMKASDDAQAAAEDELEASPVEAELAEAAESSPAEAEPGIEIARRTPPEGDDAIFEQAQIDLQRGNLEQATLGYKSLIRKGKLLDEIIFDLREGTYQHPVDVVIWLTLGDAYRRANRLQEALDAYTKAEELLR